MTRNSNKLPSSAGAEQDPEYIQRQAAIVHAMSDVALRMKTGKYSPTGTKLNISRKGIAFEPVVEARAVLFNQPSSRRGGLRDEVVTGNAETILYAALPKLLEVNSAFLNGHKTLHTPLDPTDSRAVARRQAEIELYNDDKAAVLAAGRAEQKAAEAIMGIPPEASQPLAPEKGAAEIN